MCIRILIVFFMWFHMPAGAAVTDSLKARTYSYIAERYEAADDDRMAQMYAAAWIRKAKAETNYGQLSEAYGAMVQVVAEELRLMYADSAVNVSGKSSDVAVRGTALMSRGIVYYKNRQYKRALSDYLAAEVLISKSSDQYKIQKNRFVIAQIKYYLGYYDQAAAMFRDCAVFYKNDTVPYLRSLHGRAMSLNRLGRFEEAAKINIEGLALAHQSGDRTVVPYFLQSEGTSDFGSGDYSAAIRQMSMALPGIRAAGDFANEANILLVLAKAHIEIGQTELAIKYLKDVDSIFYRHRYIHPILREAYELLAQHYEDRGEFETALHYLSRMKTADKMMSKDYDYLLEKMLGEYNPRNVIRKEREFAANMYKETLWHRAVLAVAILLLIVIFLLWRRAVRRSRTVRPAEKKSADEKYANINPKFIEKVGKGLKKFEDEKRYLNNNMDLKSVAKFVDVNPTYVSIILLAQRGQKINGYLNDLRIQHLVHMLTTDPKSRKYKSEVLAKSAGFATSATFTTEFRARMGVTPKEFIQTLE